MKILIVDDTVENLEAAKEAAKTFPEHKFRFMNLAKEAIETLNSVDAIITDLFFPDEGHKEDFVDEEGLGMLYNDYYKSMVANPIFNDIVRSYYRGNRQRADNNHLNALELVSTGSIQYAIEGLISFYQKQKEKGDKYEVRDAIEQINRYNNLLQNLPAPEFPYGAAIMLKAKKHGKRHCLVSNIHCHTGGFKDAASAMDGMLILMPLMEIGVLSIEQARDDGRNSLIYIGESEIHNIYRSLSIKCDYDKPKTNPVIWEEAIRRVLAQ